VASLETTGERAPRVEVDQDSQIEEITRRRLAVAEAHSRPTTRADHQRFDQRIRANLVTSGKPAVPKARQSLRQAFIWSEVPREARFRALNFRPCSSPPELVAAG
jgi:hypothetical protein